MISDTAHELRHLYARTSKHSGYQLVHPIVAPILGAVEPPSIQRYEDARERYFLNKVSFVGKAVADVGGNTGYFSFMALANGAARVDYVEGNRDHATFVQSAARATGHLPALKVHDRYVNLERESLPSHVDVLLLLNVLHHIGDDYGGDVFDAVAARSHIGAALRRLQGQCAQIIFQLGFNWQGDRRKPLFDTGTKAEMIDFIRKECGNTWKIQHVGIAERLPEGIVYRDADQRNIVRDDRLGEFLNRPIFILGAD
ncbi:hypothetical protein [Bordetella genomosp. 9]|uniref:Methyltransferase domain-containing protein n=1 Tax=Bordetella genomosp. 9 TaxID=1416803 RepID=A0A1W6Z151_9BORD|nr:hypothetical protein [Bordetella genomosp. 9]ARP86971.1 hypothetical protein CAL13_12680 [Bordetella genomosp. 9]